MLTSLSLTNFKAWASIENMRLAPITGLFGKNSSGKSSILQFLLMLKQTADTPDRGLVLQLGNDKTLVSLGTFSDVAHGHLDRSSISMAVGWTLPKPLKINDPETENKTLFSSDKMKFSAEIAANGGGKLSASWMQYSLGNVDFKLARKDNDEFSLSTNSASFRFKRAKGRKWPLPAPVKFYGFADEVRTYHQNAGFLSELELEFEKMLRNVYYLGPLRDYPRREYTWAGGDPADMGRRGEYAIPAILASRERGDSIGRGQGKPKFSLEQYIAFWLNKLNLIDSFRVAEIGKGANLYRVYVLKSPEGPEVLVTDVGFGVSQVLPVLVLCYYAPEGSTILFEQPEIHLHPSVQAGLADVFIDAMRKRRVQIVIESHSEHLLRRLQRRVAEATEVTREKVALYFCDVGPHGSDLKPLDLDSDGNIKNWPDDFFGNEMEDIFATTDAARRHRGNTGS